MRRAKAEEGGAKAREAGLRRGKEDTNHAPVGRMTTGMASSRRSRGDRVRVLLRRLDSLEFVIDAS